MASGGGASRTRPLAGERVPTPPWAAMRGLVMCCVATCVVAGVVEEAFDASVRRYASEPLSPDRALALLRGMLWVPEKTVLILGGRVFVDARFFKSGGLKKKMHAMMAKRRAARW